MHILLSDDSRLIRRNLINLISRIEGVEQISEAVDVPHAIEHIRHSLPDVVILDLHMPGGSGLDVLSYIKEQNIEVEVIVLTNYATEYYKKKSLELGAQHFFDKSTEFNKVITLLGSMKSTKKKT
ncbi:MAG: response regulator transcription factor [Spirochaetia bacterium]|nr:response regulator transcription factor [Spirochaetia bacterium]